MSQLIRTRENWHLTPLPATPCPQGIPDAMTLAAPDSAPGLWGPIAPDFPGPLPPSAKHSTSLPLGSSFLTSYLFILLQPHPLAGMDQWLGLNNIITAFSLAATMGLRRRYPPFPPELGADVAARTLPQEGLCTQRCATILLDRPLLAEFPP